MENNEKNVAKNNATELVFILDESGSMADLREDTIGGFNSVIEEQKKTEGEVLVSCVVFSNESRVAYDRVPISKIGKMTGEQYRPGGSTALIDAMGDAIHHISNVHKYIRPEDCPSKTMFVIMTDGFENASTHRTSDEVKKMVSAKKEAGWEFLFLGANIDAVETAKTYGISADRAVRYKSDKKGTGVAFNAVAKAAYCFREHEKLCEDWCEAIEADVKKRGV